MKAEIPKEWFNFKCWICGKCGKRLFFSYKFPVHYWCWFKLFFTKYRGDIDYYIMDNSD
jgi:hypothetical protein